MKIQASGEEGNAVSDNSLDSMLHSIMGGSSHRSSIADDSRGEGASGSYGDDFVFDTTDSEQDGEGKLPGEQAPTTGFAERTGEEIVEEKPHMLTTGHTASNGQLCSCQERPRINLDESTHEREMGGDTTNGHVGDGNNDDNNSSTTNREKSKRNINVNNNYNGEGNGTESNSDKSSTVDDDCMPMKAEPNRWPTRQSVESSCGYIYYARIAGDYPNGVARGPKTPPAHRRRRRRRRNLPGQADGEQARGACSSQAPHKRGWKNGLGHEVGKEADDTKNHDQDEQQKSSRHGHRRPGRNDLTTRDKRRGSGDFRDDSGVDCSNGLSVLERDVRGAMVAVWLAWGVRIDASREQLRREERWLDAVHRTEIAKVGDGRKLRCRRSYWGYIGTAN